MFCLVRSARKESNLQPSSYKDAALTTEPRAASRAGGNRTHTERFKRPSCCLLHYNPMIGWAYAFESQCKQHVRSLFVVVVSGSPEDRTRHNLVISKAWTTSPRLPCISVKVGHLGVEPRPSCSQSRRASICTCIRFVLPIPSAHIFLVSGPGGARILVCGSSDRR